MKNKLNRTMIATLVLVGAGCNEADFSLDPEMEELCQEILSIDAPDPDTTTSGYGEGGWTALVIDGFGPAGIGETELGTNNGNGEESFYYHQPSDPDDSCGVELDFSESTGEYIYRSSDGDDDLGYEGLGFRLEFNGSYTGPGTYSDGEVEIDFEWRSERDHDTNYQATFSIAGGSIATGSCTVKILSNPFVGYFVCTGLNALIDGAEFQGNSFDFKGCFNADPQK